MTIQIELDHRSEELLETQARLKGVPVEQYAGSVLQQALSAQTNSEQRRVTQEEFQAFLDTLAGCTPGVKLTVEETFDRESIYGDHD